MAAVSAAAAAWPLAATSWRTVGERRAHALGQRVVVEPHDRQIVGDAEPPCLRRPARPRRR